MKQEHGLQFPTFGSDRINQASEPELQALVREVVRNNSVIWSLLKLAAAEKLPDAWIVSGAIYQNLWNAMLGLPQGHGIKDYDLVYFDGADLSWQAEDRIIKRIDSRSADLGVPVEVRNQARVHLWYPDRFGADYPKLQHATHSLDYYASKTHAVAVGLEAETENIKVHAPFGLRNIFDMLVVPNYALDNKKTHQDKAARLQSVWSPVTIIDWEDDEFLRHQRQDAGLFLR
ncbi:nucleotidyltransferase family protein [Pseudovibrio sp. SPO723]|uniref:nucleotidyltransferase family protein n=1 Tax=Nesiotobacter zosterae TaxID=392721 RepID=UPI0029C2E405|nr:nucleotidyltransferase family protein [Pseudovibrio sp. SPO723]MDX5592270.1 nucleotidyltransferase family protein [Pseudovibrio sp. SPO723]